LKVSASRSESVANKWEILGYVVRAECSAYPAGVRRLACNALLRHLPTPAGGGGHMS